MFLFCFISEVFKARDRKNGRLVALKKVCMENEKEGVSNVHVHVLMTRGPQLQNNLLHLVE